MFVYTQRFDGAAVVLEVSFEYVRVTPSLNFGTPRVIWSGAGAPSDLAGSDGLFFTPANELMVANWEPSRAANPTFMWKFDPSQTDAVIEGPSAAGPFAFHLLLHPNMDDFLATAAFGGIVCNTGGEQPEPLGCFGVFDHTPLTTSNFCVAPLESVTGAVLQPVTFIGDENLNIFTIFSDGTNIQFGGGGFASFDLDTTTSTFCSGSMAMTQLIPLGIEAAHSMSWDPFLSDANHPTDPHSDFILFANTRISHVRVDDPGTPQASAAVVSTVDMKTEAACNSLLPDPPQTIPPTLNEFDQGAVTGEGIAFVGDEATGNIALIDYRQNTNGTILDPANMVCLISFLSEEIDDIAPLTGLGAPSGFIFGDSFEIFIDPNPNRPGAGDATQRVIVNPDLGGYKRSQ
jgi:hypothetical protein